MAQRNQLDITDWQNLSIYAVSSMTLFAIEEAPAKFPTAIYTAFQK